MSETLALLRRPDDKLDRLCFDLARLSAETKQLKALMRRSEEQPA